MPSPAKTIAADIITRAMATLGRYSWDRMSPECRLVEVRAILCCDMLRVMDAPDHALMVSVHRELITIILPE